MPFITIKNQSNPEQGNDDQLYYQEVGSGKPVILIHGWPLNHQMWEYQLNELPNHNIRAIAYDRRGFGKSLKPWNGYDYDTFASDLNQLIQTLDLNDVMLVGFSMGGGEVARYLSKYNTEGRVTSAVLVSAVTPFLLKTSDNPDGVPQEQFDGMEKQIQEDRPKFLNAFGKAFYGVNLINHPVSAEILQHDMNLAMQATGYATLKSMKAWATTDFREDVKKINVPLLVIHGEKDGTVPIAISAEATVKLAPHAEFKVYEDAPHGLYYTHREQLNGDIIQFATK